MLITTPVQPHLNKGLCGNGRTVALGQKCAQIPIVPSMGKAARPQRTRCPTTEALGYRRLPKRVYRWVTRAELPMNPLDAVSNLMNEALFSLGAFSMSCALERVHRKLFCSERRLLARCRHNYHSFEQGHNPQFDHLSLRQRKELKKLTDEMIAVGKIYADLARMRVQLNAHLSHIDRKH